MSAAFSSPDGLCPRPSGARSRLDPRSPRCSPSRLRAPRATGKSAAPGSGRTSEIAPARGANDALRAWSRIGIAGGVFAGASAVVANAFATAIPGEPTRGSPTRVSSAAPGVVDARLLDPAPVAAPSGDPPPSAPPSAASAAAHEASSAMWRAKWRSARELGADPGFHLPHAHPALVRYKTLLLGAGVTSPPEQSKRVFVPLCGRSVDLVFLAACGHRVLGVEMDASACESFFEKSGLPRTTATAHRAPSRRDHTNGSDEGSGSAASRDWDGWGAGVRRVHSSGNVAVVEGDVFSLRAAPDPAPDPDPSSRRSRPFGFPTRLQTARGGTDPESGAEASGSSVPWGDAFASPKRFAFRVRATLSGARKDPGVVKVFSPGVASSEFSGDSDSDARIGTRGSISFAEEALRFAEGGGPAMDAVWDRGALVAVEPSLRPRYAELVAGRLAPGGKMLLVATERGYGPRYGPRKARTERDGEISRSERDGDARTERDGDVADSRSAPHPAAASSRPPHDVSHAEVRRLYEPLGLAVERLATRDAIETAPGWMREEGVESLAESVYLLTKRVESRRGGGEARARKGLW